MLELTIRCSPGFNARRRWRPVNVSTVSNIFYTMKIISAIIFGLTILAFTASAQRNVTPAVDTAMEADAKHNLDVARQAFSPLKKAYKQVILRFEETYAAYPDFTGIDEFLYLAGMSSYYLSEHKGKQQVDLK